MGDNPKKSNITDMRYGEMNSLGSAYGTSTFDPNRVDLVSVLQTSNTNYYTANLLRGKRRWNAIVLRSTAQTHATVSSEFQRTYTSYERGNDEAKFAHFTYKIYIAELDGFKKIPEHFSTNVGGSKDSDSAGLINLCRDAMSPLGQSYGAIDYGTPVEVVFADQEKLRNPIIVDVHWKRRISLEAGKQPLWTHTGPRMTIRGTPGAQRGFTAVDKAPRGNFKEFYIRLRTSSYFTYASREMLIGLTANANNESGYRVNAAGDRWKGSKQARSVEVNGKWECSFGYWQMNVCSATAGGSQFAKYFNIEVTDAENRTAKGPLFKTITNEEKQFEFVAQKLRTLYNNNQNADSIEWARLVAVHFEQCTECADIGGPLKSFQTGWEQTQERMNLASSIDKKLPT